jgi:hypothetical protein
MNYYKILNNNLILEVINELSFRKYQKKNQILLICKEAEAQYVQSKNGTFYRANWMVAPITDKINYETVQIIRIDKSEYEILFSSLETEMELPTLPPVEMNHFYDSGATSPEPEIELVPEPTTEYIRSVKLKEMSYNCNKTITNGFDITLSDGNSYHFSLTTQDQLNLITLATMVESGETQIPYHADGEPCKFYSTLDIKAIIDKATEFKTYHISYYNSLKIYINSMETMEEISEVTYGIEIPEEYQSEVLKTLNK